MGDVILYISIPVALGILLIGGIYLIINYQHPDDKNEAWIPKLVVLIGFILAGVTVLMLPLDVANNKGCAGFDSALCGGLNMALMWDIVFWAVPVWVFFMIPFSTFYYEADDGMLMAGTSYSPNPVKKSRLAEAACYQFFVILIVGVIFGVTYALASYSAIPVREFAIPAAGLGKITLMNSNVNTITPQYDAGALLPFQTGQLSNMQQPPSAWIAFMGPEDTITLQVSLSNFYGGLMAWLGWFLLAVFGGIGLAALPLDLILAFVHRPRHMDAVEFAEAQLSLRERVNELVDVGELLKVEREENASSGTQTTALSAFSLNKETRKAAKEERQAILGFKQAVFLMEKDVSDFRAVSDNYENYNPLIPYISIVLGFFAVIISFLWILQIIVYVFPNPPWIPFLNTYFLWFDSWFGLFGILSVALFTVYLLFCAVKGCFKFGLRFMFFKLHPMEVGKTYMSSFMFNIGLVLLCALPVVQFCQDAFSEYCASATIRQIFGVQIKYLTFFGWFWNNNFFVYCFTILFGLTVLYLACRPRDQAANGQGLRDRLRSRRSSTS